jgi:hypothetical protein
VDEEAGQFPPIETISVKQLPETLSQNPSGLPGVVNTPAKIGEANNWASGELLPRSRR